MLKKYKPYIILFYVLSAGALIAAVFADLDIDKWLNNPQSPFAIWFYNTGEMPSRLICPIAGTILFITGKNSLQKFAGGLITLGGSAYLGYYISNYFFIEDNRFAFGILYGIGFGAVCLFVGRYINIPKKESEILRKLAVLGIIVMFVQLSVVEGMKYLWGRVRFRDLLADGSFDAFTPWYKINGINGNKSFPSGHTAGAAMSYLMMLLPFASKKWDRKRALCFIIPFIYSSVVAYTRLVMGAHYLSDVAMGGIISFTIIIITMKIFEKKVDK